MVRHRASNVIYVIHDLPLPPTKVRPFTALSKKEARTSLSRRLPSCSVAAEDRSTELRRSMSVDHEHAR
jgi:hypothetical protein